LVDPELGITFNWSGTVTFADPRATLLVRSFVIVSRMVDVVLPVNDDPLPVAEHAGAAGPLVAFWMHRSKFRTGDGFAPPAGTSSTAANASTTSGRRCRRRTRLVDPLASLDSLKMLTICPPYPGHD
jgi:hypothetical protein